MKLAEEMTQAMLAWESAVGELESFGVASITYPMGRGKAAWGAIQSEGEEVWKSLTGLFMEMLNKHGHPHGWFGMVVPCLAVPESDQASYAEVSKRFLAGDEQVRFILTVSVVGRREGWTALFTPPTMDLLSGPHSIPRKAIKSLTDIVVV